VATPYERFIEIRHPVHDIRTRNYFKSCGIVLADTLTNEIYGLGISRFAEPSKKAKEMHPRLSKATELAAKYAFWIGTAYLGAAISRHTGPAAGYTVAYAHPFVIGAGAKVVRSGSPALDFRRPSLGIFLASFGLLELASTPLFIAPMDKITHLAGSVSAGIAALSFTAANVAGLAFEYLGFRYLWKRFVLRNIDAGGPMGEAKGFLSEFNPLKLFRSDNNRAPASTAGAYIGQLWGNIESLWLWVQLAGLATAVAITQFYQATPDNFIDLFFQKSALWGKKFLEALAIARCCIIVEDKIKENNAHLGIK
jgi:hypothetical protein